MKLSPRTIPCALLLVALACNEASEGDDLPPGAFTSGPEDDGPPPEEGTTTDPGSTESSATSDSGEESGSSGLPAEIHHDEHILPIWMASCIDDSCHDPVDPQAGLDLSTDGVYGRLCTGFHGQTGMPYIDCEDFDPQNSYVFRKIEGTHLSINGASGGPMPPVDSLSDSQVALIEAWITEGALQ